MKKLILLVFFLLPFVGMGQGEAAWWFFGEFATADFNNGAPQSNILGSLDTDEGCSSISDACGNLQFYSDGTTVWNRTGAVMLNGTGLLGNSSAAQSAIIVPDLISTNNYYIFTVDTGSQGVNYSVVDMTLDNGRGGIISNRKNRPVRRGNVHEKISAVIHADNRSYWVMTYDDGSYQAFRVGGGAVNPTPVQSLISSNLSDSRGTIKFNPEGSMLVNTSVGDGAVVADFDNSTGVVTNQLSLGLNNSTSADSFYGAEFSPDSSLLYTDMNSGSGGNFCSTTQTRAIFQYNIRASNGNNNPRIITSSSGETIRGALQLGIDQKIYVARACAQSLGVIENPGSLTGASYRANGLRLRNGSESKEGLPPFITSFFTPQFTTSDPSTAGGSGSGTIRTDFCGGSTIEFDSSASDFCSSPIPTFDWDFGDGNTSSSENPSHTYLAPGNYTVTLNVTSFNLTRTTQQVVEIFETPVVANPITSVSICDDDGDGFATRDLSIVETAQLLGSQDPAQFIVTYHATENIAENNGTSLTQPQDFPTGTTTIWARITNINSTNNNLCFAVTSFDVEVGTGNGAQQPDDFIICETDDNGFAEFDLTTLESQITGGGNPANFMITYHETAALAASGGTQISNPSTYVNQQVDSERVFIRMEQTGANACPPTTTFVDLIVSDKPVANTVSDQAICDVANDNTEDLTLTDFDSTVLGSQTNPDLVITYHLSQGDADDDIAGQSSPFDLTGTTTFFVRIDDSAQEVCFDTTSFTINLDIVPEANTVAEYRLCDDISNNGAESFDLPSRDIEVLDGQDPAQFSVEYFTSQADADMGSLGGASPLADNYSSAGQTVVARIENNDNRTCYDTTSFDLIVDDFPIATAPQTFNFCDDQNDGVQNIDLTQFNSQVLAGQTNPDFVVSYHATQNDADAGTPEVALSYDAPLGDTLLFVRVDNSENEICFSTTSFTVRLSAQAVANTIAEYRLCDSSNDGTELFDLVSRDIEILDGQDSAQFSVEYFLSQADADLGSLGGATPLPGNYNGTGETVFARIENNDNRACASTTVFDIVVDELPIASAPQTFNFCDEQNDGVQNIDLTQFNSQVLNGQTSSNFVVSYHASQNDADMGTPEVAVSYDAALGDTVLFARVDNSANETCFSTSSFTISLSEQAVANDISDYRLCDANNNGFERFDLTSRFSDVLDGQDPSDFSIEFFTSQADADLGSLNGAIPLPNNYRSAGETLFARIESNSNRDCYDTNTLVIFVDATPTTGTQPSLIVCDDVSNDGVEDIDLSQFDIAILNGQTNPDFEVTYHASQADANSGDGALSSPYTVSRSTPAIFARVDNRNNAECFSTTSFNFIISPTPTANPVDNIVQCDDPTNDGSEFFNLSDVFPQVLNGQNASDFDITFYASSADAQVPTNQLDDPYLSSALTPEQIFVRIESVTNPQCADFTDFTILIEPQPTAFVAQDLSACDDKPFDGKERFDLSSQDDDILNGQDSSLFTVSYYLSQSNANNRINPLPANYENANDSEIIYARVENNSFNGCYDTSSFMLDVFSRPTIPNQGPITICAGVPETIDAGGGFSSYLWSTGETTRRIDVTSGGEYTVTVTNANDCDSTATITVVESDVATITELEVQQFEVKTNKITVSVEGPGDYEYSLDDFIYQASPVFDDLYPGFYTVYVMDLNGCGTVSKDVVIIGGPPFFTPNQDGFHDTWQIIAASTVPDAIIYIFDRQGKLLQQISATGAGWDGTFNGNPMPSSDYWYLVELGDGRSFKGHFALKR
jgi:gliding motility-associated-like protein